MIVKLAMQDGYNMVYERRRGEECALEREKTPGPKLLAYANGFNPQFACSNRDASPRDPGAGPCRRISVYSA